MSNTNKIFNNNEFDELVAEYLMREDNLTWFKFLENKGKATSGLYARFAKKIESAKEEMINKTIGASLENAILNKKMGSEEVDIAKGEIIQRVTKIISRTEEEDSLLKQMQILEKAMGILNTRGAKKQDKIKIRLSDMLDEEDEKSSNEDKVLRIGDI